MTRRIAGLEEGGWDRGSRRLVIETFDALAPEWHTRIRPQGLAVVRDALDRGLDSRALRREVSIEVGSGIGTYSEMIADRFTVSLAVDLSEEMVRLAPDRPAHRVIADGDRLPVAEGSADAVVLINAFLFPREVGRVLAPGGALVWVNTSGSQTPIHLLTDEVVEVLPFDVEGVESRAGAGSWCVLWRMGG